MTTPLSRRTLLRGAAGTALALPFLEAMLPARASAAGGPPSRYLISFAGHSLGSDGAPELDTHWVPKTVGTGYETPTAIAPLATVKQHVSVVSGLKIPTARSNGGVVPLTGKPDNFHGYMLSPLLSGMPSAIGSTWCRGATSDQLMARTLAGASPTPLYACVQPSTYAQGDSFQSVSFNDQAQPNTAQVSPRALFQSLFATFTGTDPSQLEAQNRELATRRLVVDEVKQSAERLKARLGGADQRRLEQHLDEVRALERKLSAIPPVAAGLCRKPTDPGADPAVGGSHPVVDGILSFAPGAGYSNEELRATVMGDLIYMAMVCDLKRSFCWQFTHPQCFMNMNALTSNPVDLHGMSHNPFYAVAHAASMAWHVKHWARLVDRLASTPEAGGTLLSNAALVWVCEGGRGLAEESGTPNSAHSSENMMALIAGHAGGLKGGVHVKTNALHPAQVLLTAMRAAGHTGTLGRITDEISGLRA